MGQHHANTQAKLVMPYGLMQGRDITDTQKVTAMWLLGFCARGATNTCWASNESLAKLIGKSERQVRRDVQALVTAGYFQRVNLEGDPTRFKLAARYLQPTKKVYALEITREFEEVISRSEVDLKMTGGVDIHDPLIKNIDLNKTEKQENTNNWIIKGTGISFPRRDSENKLPPLFIGAPRAYPPMTIGAPTPSQEEIETLPISPRLRRVVGGMLLAGAPAHSIVIRDNIALQEAPMADDTKKRRMPTDKTLSELIALSNEAKLRRPPTTRAADAAATLSQALRRHVSRVRHVSDYDAADLSKLKKFAAKVKAAGVDPMTAIDLVAGDWARFLHYQRTGGGWAPPTDHANPGLLLKLADDVVNYVQQAKSAGVPQRAAPATHIMTGTGMRIGAPPTTSGSEADKPVSSDDAFLAELMRTTGKG